MIVGLTGGIASGKTMVARIFEMLGAAVFYSDKEAREAYSDTAVREKVIAVLGNGAYSGGNINRAYISEKIFGDKNLMEAINGIIHPAVGRKFEKFSEINKSRTIIKESALLFEAGIASRCDRIVVVSAPDELRTRRIMERDQASAQEAAQKISSQLPQEYKVKNAHYIIYNDEKHLVIPQVLNIFNQITKLS